MAVSFVQSAVTKSNSTAATTISVTLPSLPIANNLLVAAVVSRKGGVVYTPSGWQLVQSESVAFSAVGPNVAVFYKVADGSETTTTFTYNPSYESVATVVEYSGLDSISPLESSSESTLANQSTITPTAITPVSTPGIAVTILGPATGATGITATHPTDYTSRVKYNFSTIYDPAVAVADLVYSTTDSITPSWSLSSAVSSYAVLALFKEAILASVPILSLPTATSITDTSVVPQVTLTFA